MGNIFKDGSVDNIYKLDGKVPLLRAIPFGLQHVWAMFVANIAPVLIVAAACQLSEKETAYLVQGAMFIAGIGTIFQLYPKFRIGSGFPIVMGISFTFVSVLCVIGANYGYPACIGAIIIGGIFEGTFGLFAKYWRKLISPIVAASVVTSIGFSLLNVGATSFGGGSGSPDFGSFQNLFLGSVTLLSCIIFSIFAKKNLKPLSVLFGLIVGYIIAIIMGVVDFSSLKDTQIVALPKILPYKPEFNIGAIVSVALIYLVSAAETMGDTSVISAAVLKRPATDKEISGAITCDGYISALSGVIGAIPITSFSQNIGIVAVTKVVNRFTILTGALIMILAGLFPAIGAALATLPEAVLGGCTIMLFGNIVLSGIQMLSDCGFTHRNVTIAALSLSIGLGFTQVSDIFCNMPVIIQNIFAQNCVAIVFVLAIIMNLILPKDNVKA